MGRDHAPAEPERTPRLVENDLTRGRVVDRCGAPIGAASVAISASPFLKETKKLVDCLARKGRFVALEIDNDPASGIEAGPERPDRFPKETRVGHYRLPPKPRTVLKIDGDRTRRSPGRPNGFVWRPRRYGESTVCPSRPEGVCPEGVEARRAGMMMTFFTSNHHSVRVVFAAEPPYVRNPRTQMFRNFIGLP